MTGSTSRQRASTSSVSVTASGWTSAFIHAGTARTGSRSESWRRISNDVEPLPTMIAARSVTVGTPDAASTSSTSWRERRCADSRSGRTGGTRPER